MGGLRVPMISTSLTQKYRLRAMHQLPACVDLSLRKKSIHGHEYKVEITCLGKIDRESGLAVDRDEMSKVVNEVLVSSYDGVFLNDFFGVVTGEMLCYIFFKKLLKTKLGSTLEKVKIQETPKNTFIFKRSFLTTTESDVSL